MMPPPRKKKRVPTGAESPKQDAAPNLSGSAQTLDNSTGGEQWNQAYQQMFDRN